MHSKTRAPYWFILPFFILFIAFWLAPIITSFAYSLTDWRGIGGLNYTGLANYKRLLNDDVFWIALKNTFVYVFVYNLIMIPLAMFVAIILNSSLVKHGRKFFRAVYFIPVTVSLAVVALVFDLLMNREFGLVNSLISALGFSAKPDWLGSSTMAPWTILIMRLWRATGYYAAFIVAGLQSIPTELYEAARVDGASELRTVRHITLPLLKPMDLFVVVMSSIWSFQLFEEPWILFQGGPRNSTLTILQYLYQNTFLFSRMGYGAAISYVLTIIVVVFSAFQFRIFKD